MRRNTFLAVFSMTLVLFASSGVNLRAQTKPATEKENAPLRVALAGLVHGHAFGFFGQFQKRMDLQVVGIAEADRQLAAQFTKKYGVPVMMEKPLAVSLEDARAIEKAARAGKIQVLVNYETTWYPSNQAAYDLVHDNAIGEIRKIVVHDGHGGPKEIGVGPEFLSWLTDPKLNGGGALFDFGCYGADLATWLMDGQRPQTVTAVTQQIKPEIYPRVDDEATIVLTYPKAQAIVQ